MADTSLSWQTLGELAAFRARNGCALSFYVDLDPRLTPTPADAQTRVNALVDEAGKGFEAARHGRTHDEEMSLRDGLARIRAYFDGEFERDGARGVAVFVAPRDDLWRALPLAAPVPDAVKVADDLYLTPLVPLAAGEAVLVAVVGRERSDLYELRNGQLESLSHRFDEQPRRHDQGGWSQANYQRHVDNLAAQHLRAVAEEIGRDVKRRKDVCLVLACPEEAKAELVGLLSSEARAACIGWVPVEAHADGAALLADVEPVLRRHREDRESKLMTRWHDALGMNGRASGGWGPTVEAASDGRVDTLLYEPRANQPVQRCPRCGRLELEREECPLDATPLERCEEGLDLVLHQTLLRGGKACEISSRPDLGPIGGIGALLRY
jgi:peptide chain release factor subunit 1